MVAAARAAVRARTMGEHHAAFAHLAPDVLWDAPPVILRGRESMRAMVCVMGHCCALLTSISVTAMLRLHPTLTQVYAAKRVAALDFELIAAQVNCQKYVQVCGATFCGVLACFTYLYENLVQPRASHRARSWILTPTGCTWRS